MTDDKDVESAIEALEGHRDFRVLRRLPPSPRWQLPGIRPPHRRALFVDVETTGLDLDTDEIIEVALLPFDYDPETGTILAVHEELALDQLRDPGIPIPPESSQVHGITDDMVKGRTVDELKLEKLVDDADLVIAHNAAFDRPMVERVWPAFSTKPWACSFADVDWRAEGFGAGKLDYLLMQQGWFYDSHRALGDCLAGTFLLTLMLPKSGNPSLLSLLQSARTTRSLLRAVGAPFEKKDALRKRGYRWDPGSDAREKSWWITVDDAQAELAWLYENIFGREVQLPVRRVGAMERFSRRLL